jgi:hypothetical protein
MFSLTSRNAYALGHSNIGNQFTTVQNKVNGLLILREDSQFRKRVVDDVKYYWRTLIGEEIKQWPKDKLPIQEWVLRQRLTFVSGLIDSLSDARKNDDDTNLIIEYQKLQVRINEGWFKSNLREILQQTFSETMAGSIRISINSDQKEIPADLCCPISRCVMQVPVIANDQQTYEREQIENYIRRQNRLGLKARSPVTGSIVLRLSEIKLDTNTASLIGFLRRITVVDNELKPTENKTNSSTQLAATTAKQLCSSLATTGIISNAVLSGDSKTDSVPITSQSYKL